MFGRREVRVADRFQASRLKFVGSLLGAAVQFSLARVLGRVAGGAALEK
jgi:hypothetical protein